MTKHIIYDGASGEIVRVFSGDPSLLNLQVGTYSSISTEIDAHDLTHHVVNAQLVPYTPEQIATKSKPLYNGIWSNITFSYSDNRTTDELAMAARQKRNSLIADIEWRITRYQSQLPNTADTPEQYQLIIDYVQQLRDLPSSAGFPDAIVWPTLTGI